MTNFFQLLAKLVANEVEFVLVGGLAAATYGSSMLTRDVDVACSMKIENLTRLHQALEGQNPRHRMAKPPRPFCLDDAKSGLFKNIYLQTDLGQLDCLGEVKGIGDFAACRSASVTLPVAEIQLPIISLDALIEAKEAMGRPRDLENAKILRAIRERQSAS